MGLNVIDEETDYFNGKPTDNSKSKKITTSKYDIIMMKTAMLWSEMSYCARKKVSAVISKDNVVISNGYNGTLPGTPNECEVTCPECNGKGVIDIDYTPSETIEKEICSNCDGKGIVTNKYTLHAEENAITRAAKSGISLDGATMYITLSPCSGCSKLIAASGIKRVVYKDRYSDTSGLRLLQEVGVVVEQLK
jgi:dCMP deaminase